MPRFIPIYVEEGLDLSIYHKLRNRYLLALIGIAVIIILSGHLITNHLERQLSDSRIVNIAGRQRMLSQKLSKEILYVCRTDNPKLRNELRVKLDSTLQLWSRSHNALKKGDASMGLGHKKSEKADSLYKLIEPRFNLIVENTLFVLAELEKDNEPDVKLIQKYSDVILQNESAFLELMDQLVFQYDSEAKVKINSLIRKEQVLMVVGLMILVLELLFIFTPIARYIQNIITDLLSSESKEKKMNKELRKLYDRLDQSKKELSELYYAVDQAIMFARTDISGKQTFISDKFIQHINSSELKSGPNLFALLNVKSYGGVTLDEVFKIVLAGNLWKDEVCCSVGQGKESWLMMTIVPVPDENNKVAQLVIVCTDINERKKTEEKLRHATSEWHKQQMAEQKVKSALILEGQEKERRRIAREIHDGIGQLLSGLKFQLESIDWSKYDQSLEKIREVKELTSNIIKEVRRVSYNLTPSVLNDYGLVSATNTLVRDLNGLTKSEISLANLTGFNVRLDKNVEVNLFRIIQETINNALKHAQAESIMISLSHGNNKLVIIIEDDGLGFTLKDVIVKDFEKMSGHGIFNMKERAGFINALFEIDTAPGRGTTIKIEVPY